MIRHLLHSATHQHTQFGKAGIGSIVLCTNRITRRIDSASVRIGDLAVWCIRRPSADQMARLAAARSSVDLALTAWEMENDTSAGARCARPEQSLCNLTPGDS
ncbi:hypothetical protein AB0K20_23180 [Micromonospora matsumotoense]|uniref:hypothetical protein n=1 Tax=Micromonospora matsumotoense TaxID=121616 RepID=UPI003415C669